MVKEEQGQRGNKKDRSADWGVGRASSVFIVYTAVARVAMNVITNALKTFGVSLDAHARPNGRERGFRRRTEIRRRKRVIYGPLCDSRRHGPGAQCRNLLLPCILRGFLTLSRDNYCTTIVPSREQKKKKKKQRPFRIFQKR